MADKTSININISINQSEPIGAMDASNILQKVKDGSSNYADNLEAPHQSSYYIVDLYIACDIPFRILSRINDFDHRAYYIYLALRNDAYRTIYVCFIKAWKI